MSPDTSIGIATVEDDAETARFVEAWLRRQGLVAVPSTIRTEIPAPPPLRIGPVAIDVGRRTVTVNENLVRLTPTEFRLLAYLAEHSDRLVGHRELLREVWGPGYEDDVHLLQVTMMSLRARLALVTAEPIVETVYGGGYRMMRQP